jgi:hypothetical protein
MLTMREMHKRFHDKTGVTFASLYPGCIAETGAATYLRRLLRPMHLNVMTVWGVTQLLSLRCDAPRSWLGICRRPAAGLFRDHYTLFKTLFPPFQKYITKGYVSIPDAGQRLAQVRAAKSGTFKLRKLQQQELSAPECLADRPVASCEGLPPYTVYRLVAWGLSCCTSYAAITAAACVPQVVSDPNMNKSGTYWSWSNEKGSFENVVSDEVADDAKAARLWALSERLVGLS